jgi:hypothetical protein
VPDADAERDKVLLQAYEASGRAEFERRQRAWVEWFEGDEDDAIIIELANLAAALEHQLDRRDIEISGRQLRIIKQVVEHTAAELRAEIRQVETGAIATLADELREVRAQLDAEREAREADRKAMRKLASRELRIEARRLISNLLTGVTPLVAAHAHERVHERVAQRRAERASNPKPKVIPWKRGDDAA